MYFIVTDDRAYAAPEITGTMKQEAKAGDMVLLDVSRMLFYCHDGRWEKIENWVHPFKKSPEFLRRK